MCLIVFLEDPDTIDPAKGYEETSRRASNGEPCLGTTFWKRLGVHPGIWWWLSGFFRVFKPGIRSFLHLLVTLLLQVFFRDLVIMTSVRQLGAGFGHDCKEKDCRVGKMLQMPDRNLKLENEGILGTIYTAMQ